MGSTGEYARFFLADDRRRDAETAACALRAKTERVPSAPSGRGTGIVIASKFAGRCRACSRTYDVGQLVRWSRGAGAVHAECAVAA